MKLTLMFGLIIVLLMLAVEAAHEQRYTYTSFSELHSESSSDEQRDDPRSSGRSRKHPSKSKKRKGSTPARRLSQVKQHHVEEVDSPSQGSSDEAGQVWELERIKTEAAILHRKLVLKYGSNEKYAADIETLRIMSRLKSTHMIDLETLQPLLASLQEKYKGAILEEGLVSRVSSMMSNWMTGLFD